MRFKPIKGNILFPGVSSDGKLVKKILKRNQVKFTEMAPEKELSGFSKERPLLMVNGRPYYGLEKIKLFAMGVLC